MSISEMNDLDLQRQMELQFEITKCFNREARLLDDGKFEEWLEWLTPSIRYWMPLRVVRKATEMDREFGERGKQVGFLDEDYEHLKLRVTKMRHTMSWSDNPAGRIIRAVSNIEPTLLDEHHCAVRSVVHAFRARFANSNDSWMVVRNDVLEKSEGSWRLAERNIYSPPSVLSSPNLDVLF